MGKSCRLLLALVLLLLAAPALAAPCGGDFNAFLAAVARDAQDPVKHAPADDRLHIPRLDKTAKPPAPCSPTALPCGRTGGDKFTFASHPQGRVFLAGGRAQSDWRKIAKLVA